MPTCCFKGIRIQSDKIILGLYHVKHCLGDACYLRFRAFCMVTVNFKKKKYVFLSVAQFYMMFCAGAVLSL
jgi:hypothetical protein